jgi:hypothetical protein
MKKTTKTKLLIFSITTAITCCLYQSARLAAIAERKSTAVGGEGLLFLIPIWAVLFYENIALTREVFCPQRKPKANANENATIRIEKINNIEVQEK